jgi:hypothetical protein
VPDEVEAPAPPYHLRAGDDHSLSGLTRGLLLIFPPSTSSPPHLPHAPLHLISYLINPVVCRPGCSGVLPSPGYGESGAPQRFASCSVADPACTSVCGRSSESLSPRLALRISAEDAQRSVATSVSQWRSNCSASETSFPGDLPRRLRRRAALRSVCLLRQIEPFGRSAGYFFFAAFFFATFFFAFFALFAGDPIPVAIVNSPPINKNG